MRSLKVIDITNETDLINSEQRREEEIAKEIYIDFYTRHKEGKMGFLEKAFLERIYIKLLGEQSLKLITPEVEIERNDGTGRKWRIDFVIETKHKKYAIECDGYRYHDKSEVTTDRFNELRRKDNEIQRQGFHSIVLSSDQILKKDGQEAFIELTRTFQSDPELNPLLLEYDSKGRWSNPYIKLIAPKQNSLKLRRSIGIILDLLYGVMLFLRYCFLRPVKTTLMAILLLILAELTGGSDVLSNVASSTIVSQDTTRKTGSTIRPLRTMIKVRTVNEKGGDNIKEYNW